MPIAFELQQGSLWVFTRLPNLIFIRIAHLMAGVEYLSFSQMKPLYFSEHLGSVESFRNLINVGRGAISYINLEDDDPHSERPSCLFVSSKMTSSEVCSTIFSHNSFSNLVDIQFDQPFLPF